jgi:hypothetical protein
MTLLVPKEAISRRWEGALQARLRRAPVEAFLRSHDIKVSVGGPAPLTDNLVHATVYLIEQSDRISAGHLAEHHHQVLVVEIACSICEELASLICEPNCGRIAALVSAAQLLSRGIGVRPAAFRAAAAARAYWKKRQSRSLLPIIEAIGTQALTAIRTNHTHELQLAVRRIEECLSESRPFLLVEEPEQREPAAANSMSARQRKLVLI